MMKSAVAYCANGTVVIAPVVRTTAGLGLEVDPQRLGATPSQADVAAALSQTLSQSQRVIAHPTQQEWKGFFQPFLSAAGVRSLKAFMATARSVGVEERDGTFVITPCRNLGAKEGFEPISSQAVAVPDIETAAKIALEKLAH